MTTVYLDNNATTPLLPSVKERISEVFDLYGNPSSPHDLGRSARKIIENSRDIVADFINADSSEIVFTSGGTESIITSFFCALNNNQRTIILSTVEHIATLETVSFYQNRGYNVIFLGVDKNGTLDVDKFKKKLIENPKAFVSIMYANNETGVIFPIEEVCDLAKEHGALIHIDAVQAVGKIPIDVKDINCDYLSLSAHKFHGLTGSGVLYAKNKTPFHSVIHGHQEENRRGGTENVLGIISMGVALKEIKRSFSSDCKRMTNLRNKLETEILRSVSGTCVNGQKNNRTCNTSNIYFPNKDASQLVEILSTQGIYVSSSAACTTGGAASHVLKAMGFSEDVANSSLRFSLSKLTTNKDIKQAIPVIADVVNKLDLKIYSVN